LYWGFGGDDQHLSLGELRSKFRVTVGDEVALLRAVKKPTRRNRRSSMLRSSGRRVSDSFIIFQNMERISFVSADGSLLGK
jgi:hypothetical protein